VFFTVMGMLVNVRELFYPSTLIFGLVYTVGAILAKLLGCGLPSLFMNFNLTGAKRIGIGMVPRGEVALIIAGIGLTYGFLQGSQYNIFSIAIMMILVTTLLAPPLLNQTLKNERKGVRGNLNIPEKETLHYPLEDKELTDLLAHKIVLQFQSMGFYVNQLDPESMNYQLSRNNITVSMEHNPHEVSLTSDSENSIFVRRMVHEAVFYLKQSVSGILNMDDLHPPMQEESLDNSVENEFKRLLQVDSIIPGLKAQTSEGIVWELLLRLKELGKIKDNKKIYYTVMAREKFLSGGMVQGVAIPHAHTDDVTEPMMAVGIKKEGVDFHSIDKKPAFIIVLILTPEKDANVHIRLLSRVSRLCKQPDKVAQILALDNAEAIRQHLIEAVYNSVDIIS
jgi:mannitol/fructose-specific phosphotransferase system IIA component (Ntr-type)